MWYVGGKYSEAGDGDTGMNSTHGCGEKRNTDACGIGDAAIDEEKWMGRWENNNVESAMRRGAQCRHDDDSDSDNDSDKNKDNEQ